MPVFRPLIAMDKNDIVDVARKIETYSLSTLPFEDCCTIFVSKHPVTKPLLERIERTEKKFDIEFLEENAVNNTEVIKIES